MRRRFYLPLIISVFVLMIGYASLNASLDVNGLTTVTMADFDVYYSNAKVNGVQDITVVESATELKFSTKLSDIDEVYELTYTVANGSNNYDAYVDVICSSSKELESSYITLENNFDTSTVLEATKSRTGIFLVSLDDSAYIDEELSFTCKINAEPVETSVIGEDEVDSALSKCKWEFNDIDTSGTITLGDEYYYCNEGFNVIANDGENVSLLAKYNLNGNYRQSETQYSVSFSSINGWEYTPGPKEIDIQSYEGNAQKYLNRYVDLFKYKYLGATITGDFITLSLLEDLGCTIPLDYGYTSDSSTRSCANSLNGSWLLNGQYSWTRSAGQDNGNLVWRLGPSGHLGFHNYYEEFGIRPIINLPIEILQNNEYKFYGIGTEIEIDNEIFNVIGETSNTVTMLAQYNLGTDYRQSTTQNSVTFSDTNGWEYTPGPKEIDIQVWSTNPKIYINEYVTFLQEEIGDSTLSGDLITMSKLKDLGCTVTSSYSDADVETCMSSKYSNWLVNNQSWWTKSANADYANSAWIVYSTGELNPRLYKYMGGIRPVITISKDILIEYLESNQLQDPQIFCENMGFSYGILNVQTYIAADYEYGDDSKAVYLCSNSDFEYDTYGYDAEGNNVYVYSTEFVPWVS